MLNDENNTNDLSEEGAPIETPRKPENETSQAIEQGETSPPYSAEKTEENKLFTQETSEEGGEKEKAGQEEKPAKKKRTVIKNKKGRKIVLEDHTDRHGRAFDPRIHWTEPETGAPYLTTTNKLRLKQGVDQKIKKEEFKTKQIQKEQADKEQAEQVADKIKAEQIEVENEDKKKIKHEAQKKSLGGIATHLFLQSGEIIAGEKFRPESKEEVDQLSLAFEDYIDTFEDLENIPAWAGLAVVTGMYTLKHSQGETDPNSLIGRYKKKQANKKTVKPAPEHEEK